MSVGETTGRVVIIAGWTDEILVASVVGVSNTPTVGEGKEVGARVRVGGAGAVGVEVGVFVLVFVGDGVTVPVAVGRTVGVLAGRTVAIAGLVGVLVGVAVTAGVGVTLWPNPIMATITATITRLKTRPVMATTICLLTMGNNKRYSRSGLMT